MAPHGYIPSYPVSMGVQSHSHARSNSDDVTVDLLQRQAMRDQGEAVEGAPEVSGSFRGRLNETKNRNDNRDREPRERRAPRGPREPREPREFHNKNNQNDPNNTTLVVTGIPHNVNTINHLNEHFSKFGPIVNIEILQTQKKANVKFSSHNDANKAFRSPEVTFTRSDFKSINTSFRLF